MKLLWFVIRWNTRKSLAVSCLGLLSGIASAGLIATVNHTLQLNATGQRWVPFMALTFAVLLLVKVFASVGSSLLLGRLSQESILSLCAGLCRKTAATPFRDLEKLGSPRILTCLTDDVMVLSGAIQAIPPLIINGTVLAGCATYLAWISPLSALLLAVVMTACAICYKLLLVSGYPAVRLARTSRETLFRHFCALTDGIKELKVHRERRQAFFREEIDVAADCWRRQNVIAMNRYALADGWGQTMFGLLLATLLFLLPTLTSIAAQDVAKYVLAALYVMAPAWGIIGTLPGFIRGQASLERLAELGLALDGVCGRPPGAGAASVRAAPVARKPPMVEFRKVTFSYSENGKAAFSLGPLDLDLRPGELIFVVGGNGSGKSSLVKLLTGLYRPDAGDIYVNGKSVSAIDPEEYTQLFSVVYSDFYLFDRLLGISGSALKENANHYLAALDLSHKVRIEDDSFSTTNVSQGQRRRLALLTAYMEDRPIYVLDEWAADQDPAFRQVFYLTLLPELKQRGKTVIVVTHDDRYFHIGDQIIKLEGGKVVQTVQNSVSVFR
jgi:putative pyoverdin transport system ATP-binding/permease protein